MAELVVVRPDRVVAPAPHTSLAPRARPKPGDVLVIVDNGKPNAGELLAAFARRLIDLLGLDPADVQVERKPAAGQPITEDRARALGERATIAITGLGDCGGCSACSVHDAVLLERFGVPAVPVITEPFQGLAGMVADRLGLPGLSPVVVPHPVSTKDQPWLEELAERHADRMASLLAERVPA